jgi:hypothetical protein
MPLSNADNPTADPVEPKTEPKIAIGDADVTERVAESAPVPAKKPAKAAAVKPEKPVLAKAFTSGNAEVHNLMAEREIASSNQDKAHLAAVDEKLAALGYEV